MQDKDNVLGMNGNLNSIGYCRYCGESMMVLDSDGITSPNDYATRHCTCEDAVETRARADALSNVQKVYEGDGKYFPALDVDARAALDTIVECILNDVFESAAVQIRHDKITLKAGTGGTVTIKRERKYVSEAQA